MRCISCNTEIREPFEHYAITCYECVLKAGYEAIRELERRDKNVS